MATNQGKTQPKKLLHPEPRALVSHSAWRHACGLRAWLSFRLDSFRRFLNPVNEFIPLLTSRICSSLFSLSSCRAVDRRPGGEVEGWRPEQRAPQATFSGVSLQIHQILGQNFSGLWRKGHYRGMGLWRRKGGEEVGEHSRDHGISGGSHLCPAFTVSRNAVCKVLWWEGEAACILWAPLSLPVN